MADEPCTVVVPAVVLLWLGWVPVESGGTKEVVAGVELLEVPEEVGAGVELLEVPVHCALLTAKQ